MEEPEDPHTYILSLTGLRNKSAVKPTNEISEKTVSITFYLTIIKQLTWAEQKSTLSFVNRTQCNIGTIIPRNQSQFTPNSVLYKNRKSCSDLKDCFFKW